MEREFQPAARRLVQILADALRGGFGCLILLLGFLLITLYGGMEVRFYSHAANYFQGQGGQLFDYFQTFVTPQWALDIWQATFFVAVVIHFVAALRVKVSRRHPLARFVSFITFRLVAITCYLAATVILIDQTLAPVPYFWGSALENVHWDGFVKHPGPALSALLFIVLHSSAAILLTVVIGIVPLWSSLQMLWYFLRPYFPYRHLWPERGRCRVTDEVESNCDLLLLSDLHIGCGPSLEPGSRTVDETFAWLDKLPSKSQCRAILFVGDVTDTGQPQEWQSVKDWFKKFGTEAESVIGNHDIHLAHADFERRRISLFEAALDPYFVAQSFGELDVTKNLSELTSAGPVDNEGDDDNESNPDKPPLCPRLWRSSAPFDVLLLNSNRRPVKWPLTNAMGLVGEEQLLASRKLLKARQEGLTRECSPRKLLICLHHHVLAPWSWWAPLMVCLDFKAVLDLALDFDAIAVVHGHMHTPFIYSLHRHGKELIIVSCGSARFAAGGVFKNEIAVPSCYGLKVVDGTLRVVLYRAPVNGPAVISSGSVPS